MKQILLKLLKLALIIAVLLLGIVLAIGIILTLDWPWWVGFFILAGFLGLLLGIIFLRKVWVRRREQRFVQQVIEQDDARLRTLGGKEKERSKELQEHWKEAMGALRRSHLKKLGNPLYVLPWYMVIGESGSGKTTAIKSAHLSSPFAEFTRTSGISGTPNCDWWFFEQAIIIDTAGRYAIPVDEGRDKEEWQKFLTLLARFRKKEPLNGLVVTVGADKLLDSGPETLAEDGKSIRRRIDEMMRVLGAKFPVYVLVTKCDLVQGMTQFCNHLPETALEQAMGFVHHDRSINAGAFLDRTMHTIGERLKDLRLLLLHKSRSEGVSYNDGQGLDPSLILFPEEFESLLPGLTAFVNGTFQENPYQETPILRGIYYSSGRQEGSPYSHFLKALGLIEEREVLPGTNRGLFLHDFFSRILPKDRRLFTPTQRTLEWSRITRNLGLTAWIAVGIAICGLMSFSFMKNLRALHDVSSFARPPVFQGEFLTDMSLIDGFRQAILKVEDQNRSWWIPRFGLNESKDIEIQLKAIYCKRYNDIFLAPFDKQMAGRMTSFTSFTPETVFGQHIDNIVKRINLLRSRLGGADLEELEVESQPSYSLLMSVVDQKLIPEIRTKFANLYLYSLAWQLYSGTLNREMNRLQTWLKHLLTLKGINLHWLVAWANTNSSLSDLTLEAFWGGSQPSSLEKGASDKEVVKPAFTLKGKEQIESFLKEIESALPDPLIIASQKLEFQRWYREAYIGAWHDFGAIFANGADRLKGWEVCQLVAARMATDQGPYFSLLNRMAEELGPFARGDDLPPWIELVYEFKTARLQAAHVEAFKEKSTLVKVTKKGKRLIDKIGKKIGRLEGGKTLESRSMAAQAFREYKNALAQITPVSASRGVAYQMATQVFSEDQAIGKSPFYVARNAVSTLRASLMDVKPDEKMFWKLVAGPLDYLWDFFCKETACHLQTIWEKEVLVEAQGVSDKVVVNRLFLGQDGYAIKFIEGPAAPFVSRSLGKGFYAKEALERKVPFMDSFFTFYTKGVASFRLEPEPEHIKANYAVSIKGLPTDANKEARIRPHATRLEVQCATETLRLVNLNYPVRKNFIWSPQTCGGVIFKIEVGNLVLTRKYTGARAFPKFLKDFEKGSRTFYPAEFPTEEAALKRLGIKYIKVNYQFQGHKPVLALLIPPKPKRVIPRVPEDIAKCWDQ